ncbi:MAG: hypothetical protein DRH24_15250 [Deltaproteobacteria bacterium]|nr:MAG: hypothetical protein DRH24_15250 [Deltaproteobacteria bacterium]
MENKLETSTINNNQTDTPANKMFAGGKDAPLYPDPPQGGLPSMTVQQNSLGALPGFKPTEQPGNIKDNPQMSQEQPKPGQAAIINLLVSLALKHATFNHTPEEEPFASIKVGGHIENVPTNSRKFIQWITRIYYKETGDAPSKQELEKALRLIEAQALFDGKMIQLHIRYAEHGDCIFVDLCNREWEQVKISATGWEIISSIVSPIKFVRHPGMAELPKPVKGGSFDDFRKFLNIESNEDWVLIIAWIIGAMKKSGPFPILCLHGEQGTGKSFTAKLIRELVDPSTVALQSLPRTERDHVINAKKTWLLNYDNLSGIRNDLSDALCRTATGGGFRTRKLRTDTDEILFSSVRPMMMNGIVDVALRNDLADRSLIINLPLISERLAEKEIYKKWVALKPGILGAFYTAVSAALKNYHNVKLEKLPRMADFAIWVSAAEQALPWESGSFIMEYGNNRKRLKANTIEADLVALAVVKMVGNVSSHEWTGTATELLKTLEHYNDFTDSANWPKQPNALSGRLKRIAGALRDKGIETKRGKNGNRFIHIFTNEKYNTNTELPEIEVPAPPVSTEQN